MLQLAVFTIFAFQRAKIWDFGDPLEVPPPKGEKQLPGPTSTVVKNFTSIGFTVAEMSVPYKNTYSNLNLC